MYSTDEKFENICQKYPIVDCHNDFPYACRVKLHYELHNQGEKFNFKSHLNTQTDLTKLLEGHVGVQFFSCWIECGNEGKKEYDFNQPSTVVRDTMEQIDFVKRLCDEYPDHLVFVKSADEASNVFSSNKGKKISVTMGVEGLHQIDLSLGVLRLYYELGVRYVTLTHNGDNPFATAASTVSAGGKDKGLSRVGEQCIAEMNRLGMLVDLSHVSYKTMVDVLQITKAPVIFTHSSAYSLTNHERNVRDDVLDMVKKNDGVICVTFVPEFVSQSEHNVISINDVVDHVIYIVKRIGWDYVGLGGDFDGMEKGPVGLENTSKYPDLVKKVWDVTGASENDIAKFMGLNVLRVWKECEKVAKVLKKVCPQPIDTNWNERKWVFPKYAKDIPNMYSGAKDQENNVYTDTTKP